MRIPIPRWLDSLLDVLAVALFPSRKYTWVTLALYISLIVGALIWYSGNWLWIPAAALTVVFTLMLLEWIF